MKKLLSALCCAALLAPALSAQRAEFSGLLSQEANGSADAAYRLYELARRGQLYDRKGENDLAAQRFLSRAAELGNISARYQFATTRLVGFGSLHTGQKTAFEYLLELAKLPPGREFTRKQYFEVHALIGECYEMGKGVQPNLDLAFRYYMFASLNNENARLALARIFLRGIDSIGLKQNLNASMLEFFDVFLQNENRIKEIVPILRNAGKVNDFTAFLERKARAGDAAAAYFLAESTFTGTIFPKEVQKAMEFYQLAVDRGNMMAAIDLGDIYTFGRNFIPVDVEKGKDYYDLALSSTVTRPVAAQRLMRYLEGKNDPYSMFKYMVYANDLRGARALIRQNVQMSWSAEDIYLKAKEFRDSKQRVNQFDKRAQLDYIERLHMASNAGYHVAVADYFREAGSREYARMIWALEYDPRPNDPDWLYTLSVCYRSGGAENKNRDYKKSLEYMIKAADKGSVTAMDLLVKLYSAGSARYGVPEPMPELAKKYSDMLVRSDTAMRYPHYFNEYLANLEKSEAKHTVDELAPAFRSIESSPLAAMTLSKLYMTGSSDFQVEKDEMFAFVLLHAAAMNGYEPAVKELSRICTEGISDVVAPNRDFAAKYASVLNYIPRYTPPAENAAGRRQEETKPGRQPDRQPGGMQRPGGMPGPEPAVVPGGMPRPGGVIPGGMPGPGPAVVPGGMPRPGVIPGGMPGPGPAVVPGGIRPGVMPVGPQKAEPVLDAQPDTNPLGKSETSADEDL